MKTTLLCVAICFLFSASTAFETISVGDFIHPPSFAFTPMQRNGQSALLDSFFTPNYLTSAMGPNGRGLIIKYTDVTRRTATGTLVFKKNDGSYDFVDLPFECSGSFVQVATDGTSFLCGTVIFSLGPDNTIVDKRDRLFNFDSGVFHNNSVLLSAGSNYLTIGSNLTTSPYWSEVMEQPHYGFGLAPQIYPDGRVVVAAYDGVRMYRLSTMNSVMFFELLAVAKLNITDNDPFNQPVVLWDGGNTIISGCHFSKVGVNTMYGSIKIFRKAGGEWSLNKIITNEDLGLGKPGGLGVRLLLADENTVIVHAAEGFNRSLRHSGGSAFALEKIGDDWVITTKFVQEVNDAYLLGAMSYDKSDGRLYFTACRTRASSERRFIRECGIKYAVWNRNK